MGWAKRPEEGPIVLIYAAKEQACWMLMNMMYNDVYIYIYVFDNHENSPASRPSHT